MQCDLRMTTEKSKGQQFLTRTHFASLSGAEFCIFTHSFVHSRLESSGALTAPLASWERQAEEEPRRSKLHGVCALSRGVVSLTQFLHGRHIETMPFPVLTIRAAADAFFVLTQTNWAPVITLASNVPLEVWMMAMSSSVAPVSK
jgi:hypothetical protein